MSGRGADDGRIVQPVELGTAELVPDQERPGAWTLRLDGVAQSYVDLGDPTYLHFEYCHRLAAVVDALSPGLSSQHAARPLHVLHLGGGGLTIPRYVAAIRPGSVQTVIEIDGDLIAVIKHYLPWSPQPIDVRKGDARTGVEEAPESTYDLVVSDISQGAATPRHVSSVQCAEAVARLLTPNGVYAVNVPDTPDLAFTRAVGATLRSVFADVCLVAHPTNRPGARYRNTVFAASAAPESASMTRLRRAVQPEPFPGSPICGAAFDEFVGDAVPITD